MILHSFCPAVSIFNTSGGTADNGQSQNSGNNNGSNNDKVIKTVKVKKTSKKA